MTGKRPFKNGAPSKLRFDRAFTLFELLVVIGIVGLLAAITVPSLKGFGDTNKMAAANRQLLDDVAFAQKKAQLSRTTVYMVFASPDVGSKAFFDSLKTPFEQRQWTNVLAGQYTSYALLTLRSAGEQPGRIIPQFLTTWRTLPDGVYFNTNKFQDVGTNDLTRISIPEDVRPFRYEYLPVPTAASALYRVPAIAFNSKGQVTSGVDELIPLVRGIAATPHNADGVYTYQPAIVKETPPGNSTNNLDRIRINWLTGHPRVEKLEFQ